MALSVNTIKIHNYPGSPVALYILHLANLQCLDYLENLGYERKQADP